MRIRAHIPTCKRGAKQEEIKKKLCRGTEHLISFRRKLRSIKEVIIKVVFDDVKVKRRTFDGNKRKNKGAKKKNKTFPSRYVGAKVVRVLNKCEPKTSLFFPFFFIFFLFVFNNE